MSDLNSRATADRFVVIALAAAIGLVTAGCASRTVVEEQPIAASRPPPQEPAYQDNRQAVGAPQPVWMDDPARRRGPQGQPAPYGRDTVTGKPLSDLPPEGAASPPPTPRYLPPPARPAPAPMQPAGTAATGSTVVVQRGETLFAIARRNNVSIDALKRTNNLTADGIREGQTLVIPGR